MLKHLQDGYTINLPIDGNESDIHLFCPPAYNIRLTTPLGFNYDSRISGSIAAMIEACDLVNIHTLQHRGAPATHRQGSQQINFMCVSRSLIIHVEECGILPFNSMFSSNHIPLYVDFNISTIFGPPSIGTEKAALRDLQLDNPRLIDAYKSAFSNNWTMTTLNLESQNSSLQPLPC
jgi:hypothetical protein